MSTLPTTSGGSIANFLDGEDGDLPPGQRGRRRARRIHHAVAGAGRRLRHGERHDPRRDRRSARTRSSRSARSDRRRARRSPSSTTTPPVVSAAVINKTLGDKPGFVKQGGTYFVYANANDAAGTTGTHVVSTVTANVTNITTGSTAVALTTAGGPWTVGGVSYTYRSASLTATNPQIAGSKTFTVTATDVVGQHVAASLAPSPWTTRCPLPRTSRRRTHRAPSVGRAETGDTITYTFSEPIDPSSILVRLDRHRANGDASTSTTAAARHGHRSSTPRTPRSSPFGIRRIGWDEYYVTATGRSSARRMVMSGSHHHVTLGTAERSDEDREHERHHGLDALDRAATDLAGNACAATTRPSPEPRTRSSDPASTLRRVERRIPTYHRPVTSRRSRAWRSC